jgi:hypothetical protein
MILRVDMEIPFCYKWEIFFDRATRKDPREAGAEGARPEPTRLKLSGKRTGALEFPGKLQAFDLGTERESPWV